MKWRIASVEKQVCGAIAALLAIACAGVVRAGPSIQAIRFGGDAEATRMVVDLSGPSSEPVLTVDHDRLTLDLAAAADDLAERGVGRGLVGAWSAQPRAGEAHLAFALRGSAHVTRRFFVPPNAAGGGWRYVIDLAPGPDVMASTPTDGMSPPPPVSRRAGGAPIVSARLDHGRADRGRKVVVIDAGHGGHDSGALGASHQEKELTLAAALALKERLERSGRYHVILTRDSDVFIPLADRVKIARKGGVDLFLSLHADSAGADANPHGASVYTLSDSGVGRAHYVIGHNEWFTKVATRSGDAGVSQILLDLSQRSTRNHSSAFADLLLDKLRARGVDLLPRGHRDAGYFVLLAPDVPAALLEMGFVTNPEDEERLSEPKSRAGMMDAVADAIDDYFNLSRATAPLPPKA